MLYVKCSFLTLAIAYSKSGEQNVSVKLLEYLHNSPYISIPAETQEESSQCSCCWSTNPIKRPKLRTSQCTEDAISTALHSVFTHLENNNGYIRMTSSQADPRQFRLAVTPSSLQCSTLPPPQGCVLSPLSPLYAHNCTPRHQESSIVSMWTSPTSLMVSSYLDEILSGAQRTVCYSSSAKPRS